MFELLCPIKKHAINSPNSIALIEDREKYTYKQLDQKVDELCFQLKNKGVQMKQRVAFVATSSLHTILLFFALSRMQATACPLSFRLPYEQIPLKLKQLKASFFVEPHSLSITPLKEENPYFEKEPLFALLFTSGSSKEPKIAALSFENFYYSALGSNLALSLKPKHRWLLSLPLYHVGGIAILFRCFMSESAVVLSNLPMQDSLTFHKISHLSLVPTQLYRLLLPTTAKETLSSLECILLGGAPIPIDLFKKGRNLGLKLFPTYGMTEMSSQITQDSPNDNCTLLTCGEPLPFREVKMSENGEIIVRGKTLFQGYFTQEEGLKRPLENGWFATNDMGKWSSDHKLIFVGRKDSLFISGGENIYPEEIERVLCELPGIIQAYIVPVEDKEFGQRPFAFIQEESDIYTIESIRELLQTKLPKYALPIQLEKLIPHGDAELKVSRSVLKKLAAEFSKS